MSKFKDLSRPVIASFITLLGVIFLPYAYQQTWGLGSANHIIRWPLWIFLDSFYFSGFTLIELQEFLSFTPAWIMRFLLVFWVSRYYSGRSSRRQTFAIGMISELPPLLLSLSEIIANSMQPPTFSSVLLPIPVLLGFVVLLIFLLPYDPSKEPWK